MILVPGFLSRATTAVLYWRVSFASTRLCYVKEADLNNINRCRHEFTIVFRRGTLACVEVG